MDKAALLQPRDDRKPWARPLRVGLAAILLGLMAGRFDVSVHAATQLTVDQATERCRESAGRPFVQSCVRAKVQASGGPPPKYIEGCRAAARPAVQACVTKMMAATGADAKGDTAVSAVQPTADLKSVSTENVAFVAPPRSAADVTEILDKQKPDPERISKLVAQADSEPPAGLKPSDLADFYYKRAQARAALGRLPEAIADARLAIRSAQGADYTNVISRYEQFLYRRLREDGQTKAAIEIINRQIDAFSKTGRGRLFGLYLVMLGSNLQRGDIARAEDFLARSRALLTEARAWPAYSVYATSFTATVEEGAARLAEARGRFADAEVGYRKAAQLYSETIGYLSKWPSAPPAEDYERQSDYQLALEGRAKVKLGRTGEGEANVRRALLSRLSKVGKYHTDTALALGFFVYVLQEQGRYEDAEKLQRQVIDIYKGLGYGDDSGQLVNAQLVLANLLSMQRHYDDAGRIYDQADRWTANWEPTRRDATLSGLSRMIVSINQGNPETALDVAKRTYDRARTRSGDDAPNTVVSRGFLAVALARNGKREEAYQYFTDAIPKMLKGISASGDADSGTTAAASEARLRFIMESYFSLLSRNPQLSTSGAAVETFAYSDAARGQAVQRALQASSVRSAAKNPELAQLVRVSQDSEKQLGAAIATENNLLSQPNEERDAVALREVQAQIQKLQAARAQAEKDIAQRFPDYGSLTKPAPPTPVEIQAALTDDEAFISFYFGRFESFVWVVRKDVPVTFSRIGLSAAQLETEVNKLREALEPKAAMISDIPAFDVVRASALYDKLLRPVEGAWRPAKRLVVVTNGALGLLPLSLLPIAPAEINRDDDPLFSSYRKVPWLARTHAVSLMPSASALVTLRKLPPAKPGRTELVAFGDPLFSQDEADEAAKAQANTQIADAGVTRGAPLKRRSSPQLEGVASADLAMLPRLPDTADELKSIALALQADPSKALHLGKDANEQVVKSMDLSGVKVLAFATHGLVPGELDGLTQPALALSAPAVAGVNGDGLLTMEEILTLKLDADWVVLSACNTGAGSGAGAEAASGLGHAFFYAGTKALLVTNWSVHSESARELVSDLFKRQAADPNLARSEALRQAMMALVDEPGYVGSDGKTAFAYAHPLFWAPYSIIGDGGASQN